MRTRLVLVILLVWFLAIVVAFTHYQFRGFEQANPFGDYVLSALAVLVAVVVATALGLRVLAPERPRPRDAVLGLAVGLAILAIAALALAAAKMLRPYVIWPAMVAAGALSYRQVVTLASLIRAFRLRQLTAVEGVLIGLLSLAGLIVLANCLAPLTANDALVYHLNLPKIYARASGLVQMPHLVYANMPHYGEMLYALFYVLAGETGAKLAYLVLMAGAALAVYVLARRFAPRSLALGVAAIFLVEPLVLDSRIVCNVDVLLTYCYIVAITLVLES
ncbi:MAG TPA: hypothetical protein VMU02_00650, partial [bacterium]|nr:hypothetical protein [bacterium]